MPSKRKELGKNSLVFFSVERAVKLADSLAKAKLELDEVYEEEGEDCLFANLYGGLNGCGKWSDYLSVLASFTESQCFSDCWILSIDNDALDDVFEARIGFRLA